MLQRKVIFYGVGVEASAPNTVSITYTKGCLAGRDSLGGLATAAEDKKESDYNKPDPVIVKEIAKTVIHKRSSI